MIEYHKDIWTVTTRFLIHLKTKISFFMERSDIQVILIKKNSQQSKKEICMKNMIIEYHIGKRKFKEKLDYMKKKKG